MKKVMFTMLMLLGVMAMAQSIDCKKFTISKYDEVTGNSSVESNKTLIISNKSKSQALGISMMYYSNTIAITIKTIGSEKCLKKGSNAYVLFTDGTRITLKNDAETNCEYSFELYFDELSGNKNFLDQLKTKKIKTLRIFTYTSFVEETFTNDQAETFKSTLSCLTK